MNKKYVSWLLLLLLLFSFFPLNTFTTMAADPVNIYLITQGSDYTNYSFTDLGIYYTPQALCEFHMPFVLERAGGYQAVNNTDLDGTYDSATGSFNERLLSYNYSVLDSNANYYVVDFVMNTSASTDSFSVDFVPKIKGVAFEDYAWWNSNWSYKKEVTIDYTQVPSTLTNFPVLVYRATDSNLSDHVAQADGGDIAFIDSTETTQFNHEIEYYNGGPGQLAAWVNVTSVSHHVDSQTTFWMYYGNAECADQWDIPNTWDSRYTGVYHMDDVTSTCVDSTSNSNDGTYTGSLPTRVTAQVYYGQGFDGTNDNITIPKGASVNGEGTIELWAEPDIKNSNQIPIVSYGDANNHVYLGLWNDATFRFTGKYSGSNLFAFTSSEKYEINTYYYIAGAWTFDDTVFWVNGTSRDTDTDCETTNFTLTMSSVGTDSSGGSDYDGEMDELRISNIRRSNDWLVTCYNTQVNQSTFCTFGAEEVMGLVSPTNFTASTESNGDITLAWDIGTNATHTYIERNVVSSWSREDGTFIYNDTGVTVLDDDTALVCNVVYYYRAWSFNSTTHLFSGSISVNNISCPGNPSSSTATVWDGYLNITWVNNVHADAVTLVRKTGSYPTSPTDGTVLYNGTNLYYNDSSITTSLYYTLFSWNTTVGRHSTGLQRPWGQLTVNVFDENTSDAISGWDVIISNADKTTTYESLGNTNPTIIDVGEDLPYGENTTIRINATWYSPRIYILDIEVNNHYTLDAYLAATNDTESYIIRVTNEYDTGVTGAEVQVKRYINDSEGFQNISIFLTTGNGYCPAVDLIPGETYAVTIIADGYSTGTFDLFPIHITYIEDRYHIYQIEFAEEVYVNETSYSETITFNGYISGTTLYVNYTDSSALTIDTSIIIYEINSTTGTVTPVSWDNRTGDDDFQITVSGVDTSNCFQAILFLNHTTFGFSHDIIPSICLRTTITTPSVFDTLLDLNFKHCPFGWSNLAGFFLMMSCMFTFGQRNSGISLLLAGFLLLALNSVIGLTVIMIGVPIVFIILGLLVQWLNQRREYG